MLIEFDARIEKHSRELRDLAANGKATDPLYHYLMGAVEEAEHLKRFYERQMAGHLKTCHGKEGDPK